MKKTKIDEKIKPLYDFLNSLDGVRTVGSCQGHPNNETFSDPYITFTCYNDRSLGLIAGMIEAANEIKGNLEELDNFTDWFIENAPNIKGDWNITVLSGDDASTPPDKVDCYVLYCLSPHPCSYENVEETWEDPAEFVRYAKLFIKEYMEKN